jgi:hypothetical protein
MPDSTVLCWKASLATTSGHVTIADYKKWIADGENNKKHIAVFLKERLRERYFVSSYTRPFTVHSTS